MDSERRDIYRMVSMNYYMCTRKTFFHSCFVPICKIVFCTSGKGHKYFGRNVLIEGHFNESMLHGIGRVYGLDNLNSGGLNIKPGDCFNKV